MEVGKIIVGEPIKGAQRHTADLAGAMKALALFAFVFAGSSLIDMALAVGPANLAAADTRFVALAGVAGSLPLLAVGALGLELAAFGLSRVVFTPATVLVSLALLVCLAGLVLLAGAYGPTLAAAQSESRQLVRMTGIRAASSFLFFGAAFGYGAWIGWRRVLRGEHT